MFAHLISEVLCNIGQVCISTVRKAASPGLPQRLDHERSLWKAFSKHLAEKLSEYLPNQWIAIFARFDWFP